VRRASSSAYWSTRRAALRADSVTARAVCFTGVVDLILCVPLTCRRLSHPKNLVFERCYKHRRERRYTREPLGKVAEPRN
jgi:hypothetical protein